MTTTLLSLIGEQPMPILLSARHLQADGNLLLHTDRTKRVAQQLAKLLPDSRLEAVDAYDLSKIYARLAQIAPPGETLVNPTGGTKMMSFAALLWCSQHRQDFVYAESENYKTVLYRYGFDKEDPVLRNKTVLPSLISAADYLNAHLLGFREEGFSRDSDGGGAFEEAVARALTNAGYEVLCGVRPEKVRNQIEIDLVIRAGNRVGIAEVKLSGGENPKRGIDQLSTAGDREYLGTYTEKFLILGKTAQPEIQTLAMEKGVHIIALPGYGTGSKLNAQDATRMLQQVRQFLPV